MDQPESGHAEQHSWIQVQFQLNWNPHYQKTFDTKKINQGQVPQHVQDRTHFCIGHLVEVLSNNETKDKVESAKREGKYSYKADPRRKCFICQQKKTKWHCILHG